MSSCACGHHHAAPSSDTSGEVVALQRPLFGLHGRLICGGMDQMMLALDLLPDHVALSRSEPGCLRFDIAQSDDPMVWQLDELFADEDAFAVHRQRAQASRWGQEGGDLQRDIHRHPVQPQVRPERSADHDRIDRLLVRAFDGPAEARLVRDLRADGDLAVSLVAHAGGCVIGHVALSPLEAEAPAYALAPLAVHPAIRRRGLGRALVAAALKAAGDHAVVVLGPPDLYGPAGFAAADLRSPYAGPALQLHGRLPEGSVIRHPRAFRGL